MRVRAAIAASCLVLVGCSTPQPAAPAPSPSSTPTPSATRTAAPTPKPTPTPTPTPTIDPAVEEWMEQVNAGGGRYAEADAEWACEHLREEPELAAWTAVGDDRLIWAGRLLCTEFKEDVERAVFGFRGGEYVVGDGSGDTVKPGKYISEPGVKDCYWERVNASGKTIANDFVSFAPKGVTLTIGKSDGGIKLEGCGPFTLAG